MNFPDRARSALLCIALLATFSAALAIAAEKNVTSIEVRYVGTKSLSEQRVKAMLSTRVNEPLSSYRVDQDIKTLLKSGEITNARMLSENVSGGVKVIVVVECSPLFGSLAFSGNSVFSDSKLEKKTEFTRNQPISEAKIRSARHEILSMYRKRGYSETTVDYKIQKDRNGLSRIHFTVDERRPGILRKVSFVGNKSIPSTDLKEVMSQKERGLQNLIGSKGLTDPDSISDDIRAIETHYRDNGFFDASVVRVSKIPVDKRFNDLVITIDEGKGYNLSGIQVNGISALSFEKDIAPYLKTRSGERFSAEDLQADIKMITDQYRARGYINAEVVPVIVDAE